MAAAWQEQGHFMGMNTKATRQDSFAWRFVSLTIEEAAAFKCCTDVS